VTTSITPVADVIVLMSGPTNVTIGENFFYTVLVTNAGPSTAVNVVVKDNLPTNLVFVSATRGGVLSNGVITWPTIPSLLFGGTTNYTITVNAPNLGSFTNIAFATSGTLDLDLTNNNGTLPASQVRTGIIPAQLMALIGTPVFNPQTGLFEEPVTVTNTGAATVAAFQLFVSNISTNATLRNATGTNNGVPYVQYNSPLDPNQSVTLRLEFYVPNRRPFTNTVSVVAILPAAAPVGSTNGSVDISRAFTDTRIPGETRFVIEFGTIPGRSYTIIYSDDNLLTWSVATPSVQANANVTQWYDDGPPKTQSKPNSVPSRFYRVILNP